MAMKRTLDARFLNEVANHPSVRPFIGGDGKSILNLSEIISDPSNYAFEFDHGGFVVHSHGGGTYECHSLFLPEGRGVAVINAVREAMRYMFTRTDCVEIVTRIPQVNKSALGLGRATGFVHSFDLENAWLGEDGLSAVSHYRFNVDNWMMTDPTLQFLGRSALEVIQVARRESGLDGYDIHPDEVQSRALGGAVAIAMTGNGPKAVGFYNRFARITSGPQMTLLTVAPIVVDFGSSVIEVDADGVRPLLLRPVAHEVAEAMRVLSEKSPLQPEHPAATTSKH